MPTSEEPIRAAFDAAETITDGAEIGADPEDPGPSPEDRAPPEGIDAELLERLAEGASYPLNDLGNGRRLVLYYGEDLAFVSRLGWFRWDGQVWRADEDAILVRAMAHRLPERILEEIELLVLAPHEMRAIARARELAKDLAALERAVRDRDLSDEEAARLAEMRQIARAAAEPKKRLADLRKAHRNHARTSGNSARLSALLGEASVLRHMDIATMNADPFAVNCRSGTLRFFEAPDEHGAAWGEPGPAWHVRLDPHDRADRITKIMPVEYDPAAPRPVWEAFLERIQPDPAIRAFLQRWYGYCLLGITTEQKLVFNHGGGRNGKSTMVDAIARVMGDYATTVPIESLTGDQQRKGSDATPDLVRIPGARLVRASEPEQGQKMKEALIKALTGGEPILIRRMMQEFVEVTPEFKLTISGNHKPEIRGGDDGIWRRVLLVPFEEQIPKEEIDPALPERLRAEAPGILAWMVEGALAYLSGGLDEPASVLQATEDYRDESDPYYVFLNDVCEVGRLSEVEIAARDLCDAFRRWQDEYQGDRPFSKRVVMKEFKARAATFRSKKGGTFAYVKKSEIYYRGIEVPEKLTTDLDLWRQANR